MNGFLPAGAEIKCGLWEGALRRLVSTQHLSMDGVHCIAEAAQFSQLPVQVTEGGSHSSSPRVDELKAEAYFFVWLFFKKKKI